MFDSMRVGWHRMHAQRGAVIHIPVPGERERDAWLIAGAHREIMAGACKDAGWKKQQTGTNRCTPDADTDTR